MDPGLEQDVGEIAPLAGEAGELARLGLGLGRGTGRRRPAIAEAAAGQGQQ